MSQAHLLRSLQQIVRAALLRQGPAHRLKLHQAHLLHLSQPHRHLFRPQVIQRVRQAHLPLLPRQIVRAAPPRQDPAHLLRIHPVSPLLLAQVHGHQIIQLYHKCRAQHQLYPLNRARVRQVIQRGVHRPRLQSRQVLHLQLVLPQRLHLFLQVSQVLLPRHHLHRLFHRSLLYLHSLRLCRRCLHSLRCNRHCIGRPD